MANLPMGQAARLEAELQVARVGTEAPREVSSYAMLIHTTAGSNQRSRGSTGRCHT